LLREFADEGEVHLVLSFCQYNLVNSRVDSELAPLARERGIGLINGSTLHMGVPAPQGRPQGTPPPPP
jgi:L-galactose dehydrogenase